MKKNFFGSIALAAALGLAGLSPACAQTSPTPAAATKAATAAPNVLAANTPIKLRILQTISSGTAKVNDTVDFEAVDEFRVANMVVIRQGEKAFGTVTIAHPKRTFGRAGQLSINIDFIRLANGDKLPLRAVKGGNGGNHTAAMTTAVVASGLLFFPAAPLFFFIKGKNLVIPQGTEVTAYVSSDTVLSPALYVPPAVAPTTVISAKSGTELATIVVTSDPDQAEITIDGKFAGTTDSTLRVASGDHTITIEKPGFKIWKRIISVGSGASVAVTATLRSSL